MLLTIKDLQGNEEPLVGFKSLGRNRRINGEKVLRFLLFPIPQNVHSYNLAQEESLIDFDGDEYRIKRVLRKNKGKSHYKEIIAFQSIYDLIDSHAYNTRSGSMTFDATMDFILSGTGYTYSAVDMFYAQDWENFGDENRLSLLQKALERYQAEFELNGTHLTFKKRIGKRGDFQFRYGHNIKSYNEEVDTSSLSTYIEGIGKDNLRVTYTSPNADKFPSNTSPDGLRHAKPVRDERYTTTEGLLERLKSEIKDTPDVSVTVDFVDMRKIGYEFDVPNEGDDVFLIYEPMEVDLEARIVEVDEEFNHKLEPIKTKVTLSNLRNNALETAFQQLQKRVNAVIDNSGKVIYNVLPAAIQRATEALQSAQTELEFNNGIIARSKVDPNHLVLFNSAGLGVSLDGGQTFLSALTAEGLVADLVTTGTMLANRIKGGEFYLGGEVNGKMFILDSGGEVIADFDADRGGFADLYVANLTSPTVVSRNDTNRNYYVNTNTGSDDNDGSASNPFRTVSAALDKIARYNEALITIDVAGHTSERIIISGYIGGGRIVINFNTYRLDGTIRTTSNSNQIEVNQGRFNNPSYETSATVYSSKDSYVSYRDCRWFGQNSVDYGIHSLNGSQVIVEACEFNNIKEQAIRAERAGKVIVKECTGESKYGLVATDGGLISGGGTAPLGTVSNTYETYGGQITGHFTYPVIVPPTPPPAPSTTNTWNSTGGDSWRDNFGGQWFSYGYGENAVVQGYYGGYGIYRGLWLFGTSPSTAITGKTIKSMRLYVKRKANGGRSGDVTCYFKPHSYTSRPSGVPSFGSPSTQSSYKWGEGKWINIPSSFFAGFQSGSYKGIGIYINSTNTANYAKFFTDAKLEITYE